MSNESFPDLLKIGSSKHDPRLRASQLFTTGVPTPFVVEFAVMVQKYCQIEKTLHDIYSEVRESDRREFFRISLSTAIAAVVNELSMADESIVKAKFNKWVWSSNLILPKCDADQIDEARNTISDILGNRFDVYTGTDCTEACYE